ncbi:taurine catabolism dioxygenase TauD [Pseudomonas sp. LLC-1]|uniref:TauD/TfdA family dioxygenase n=1 Tax=Pseudomonas sp. LLC-1 TaxID=1812180 RepID=UPI000D019D32|nr:TauD/TfdA family dioxygenase [Pseudomonas sp. LLC-1]PRN03794.1 taurine catabolism dioxygenase TauD [Pseudomonas sp. LLC-1]
MDNTCMYKFTDSERDQLARVLATINYDTQGDQVYITDLRMAAASTLPRRVIDILSEQRASLHPKPYLVFENLPVDEQVFTTPDPQRFLPACKSGTISENLIMMFAALIGEPYSVQFEGANIVNNLIPGTQTKGEYTGLGSDVELDFHIENAALKFMDGLNAYPLGLLLTGVRHDRNGPMTRLADARNALDLLDASDVSWLRQPLYQIKVPYRWRKEGTYVTPAVPMVCGSNSFPEINAVFYPDMVEALNARAAQAMEKFHDAIKTVSIGVDIKPGMLAYIDNRFTLHSRDRFSASLDDLNNPMRWVQRVFVANNLWGHRQLQRVKSRIFLPQEASAC